MAPRLRQLGGVREDGRVADQGSEGLDEEGGAFFVLYSWEGERERKAQARERAQNERRKQTLAPTFPLT